MSTERVRGRLAVPPSKSLTHRYFNLALLARRPLVVERPLDAEDTRLFRAALRRLGYAVEEGPERVAIAPGERAVAAAELDCGNAGTLFRFLVASLTTLPGRWRLDGVPRLRERPVGPLVAALRRLGAVIECAERDGYAPLTVHGGTLVGGITRLDAGDSSQFLSALLMAGLAAREAVTVEVAALTSAPYVELTVAAIGALGGAVERPAPGVYRVRPTPLAAAGRVRVEGDFSAACYPAAAAALTGGPVVLAGLAAVSRQGDRGFFDLLARMGATVRWRRDGEVEIAGPADGALAAVEVDLGAMPDQVPTLAALAPFARGTTVITGVPHLRIKESDRLAAMAAELTRLGAVAEERPDGLVVPGVWADRPPPSDPVRVDPHGDHRIAMSLAVAALRRPGVTIDDPGVVAKSYPGFWDDFASLRVAR
jgi:3-phosphoshikimate 1-carboxyvinyltransferase